MATLLASWASLSPLRMPALTLDAVFAAVSGINRHYWSVAVEEQFYVVWPLPVPAAALLGRLLGRHRAVGGVLLAVIAVSFTLSVTTTATAVP